jgi:hypothetical protein
MISESSVARRPTAAGQPAPALPRTTAFAMRAECHRHGAAVGTASAHPRHRGSDGRRPPRRFDPTRSRPRNTGASNTALRCCRHGERECRGGAARRCGEVQNAYTLLSVQWLLRTMLVGASRQPGPRRVRHSPHQSCKAGAPPLCGRSTCDAQCAGRAITAVAYAGKQQCHSGSGSLQGSGKIIENPNHSAAILRATTCSCCSGRRAPRRGSCAATRNCSGERSCRSGKHSRISSCAHECLGVAGAGTASTCA